MNEYTHSRANYRSDEGAIGFDSDGGGTAPDADVIGCMLTVVNIEVAYIEVTDSGC